MSEQRFVLAGVMGWPVAHTRSPVIHNHWIAKHGLKGAYVQLPVQPDRLEAAIRGLPALGFAGCNITVPFKFDAFALAAVRTERAQLGGAVNALRFDDGGWVGDNTDGAGLVNDIQRNAGRSLAGLQVLLVGSGGAAAGVAASISGAWTTAPRATNSATTAPPNPPMCLKTIASANTP